MQILLIHANQNHKSLETGDTVSTAYANVYLLKSKFKFKNLYKSSLISYCLNI